jgi:hypothetical protein
LQSSLLSQFIRQAFNRFTKVFLRIIHGHLPFDSLHLLLARFWHLHFFEFLKLTSQLNHYHNCIYIWTKEGQALASNATDKFISPFLGVNRISLAGTSFQKLKDNILWLGACYGDDYLFKSCTTTQVFIPEVIADPANNVVGQPEQL